MRDCLEMDTNEAISLDRYPVICGNINVQLLHKMLLKCTLQQK